jgi:transposase
MDKTERGHRLRGSRHPPSDKGTCVRFAGIDIAAETHVVAVVDERGDLLVKPAAFTEDNVGYQRVLELLGEPDGLLVAMEATGHYWRNLLATLAARGYQVALLNPLRTSRFAGEDLQRTKTDALDATAIARFAAQKRPAPTRLPDDASQELRELVRFRDRLSQDLTARTLQLHRCIDLGFPEFTRFVRAVDGDLATTILHEYPTAQAFAGVPWRRIAKLTYDGRHKVGNELAKALGEAAAKSVGRHHGAVYRAEVRFTCEDIALLRRRLREIDRDIERKLDDHEVGKLLTSIDGIGPTTAARLVAEFGDIAGFSSAAAMAAFVGCVPGLRQSGKRQSVRAGLTRHGNARLRASLWMPTLTAVRRNAWLKAYYEGLRARGKLPKVALVASMRKLLAAVHFVAKNRKPFVPILAGARA